MKVLITGANGQLGKALSNVFPNAITLDSNELDITQREKVLSYEMEGIGAIVNAACYTKVDAAEEPSNQELAMAVNSGGVENLVDLAKSYDIPFVHVSTDYVFNGDKKGEYEEDDVPDPRGIYAKSKASGDAKALEYPKSYIFRTSMVIGEGPNFVRAILGRAKQNLPAGVVNDQSGRLTFSDTLASSIEFALSNKIPFGLYNLTNSGEILTWYEAAKLIYTLSGHSAELVSPVSTEEYFKNHEFAAPRPTNSSLDLSKIEAAGFKPEDWKVKLREYLKQEMEKV